MRDEYLLFHHPDEQVFWPMHAECHREFNICGAAWPRDKNKVMIAIGFSEYLVHISAQHCRMDDGKMNARQQRNCAWLIDGRLQDQRSGLRKQIISFRNAEVTECHFMFGRIR